MNRLNSIQRRSPQPKRWIISMVLGFVLAIVSANLVTACSIQGNSGSGHSLESNASTSPEPVAPSAPDYPMAQVLMQGTAEDSKISGRLLLIETPEGLSISGNLIHVPPGQHGFHIHAVGNCAEQGKAAGGHFNPDQVKHGQMLKDGLQQAHAGDLGNLTAETNGVTILDQIFPGLTLQNGKYAVAGRSVILHEKRDDMSQPNGNAGARIACGLITPVR